ncbi:MAG: calcium-binding protein [Armatimonadota bacterium]
MTNIDWRIPPSTLSWLDEVPTDAPVAVLLRHSVRGPLPPGEAGNAVRITGIGESLASQLGQIMGNRLCSLHANPVLRCVQTAEAIRHGAGADLRVGRDRYLGDPGIYVVDGKRAWANWQKLDHEGVMEHLVSQDNALPGMADPDPAARFLVQHMLASAGDRPGLHVHVTHDSIVTATAARLLGESLGKDAWPWYMEGAFFWHDGGRVAVAYKEHHHHVMRTALCSLEERDVIDFARREVAATVGTDCDARFFLGGGAFKTLLTGQPPRDLDLWAPSVQDRERLIETLLSRGARELGELSLQLGDGGKLFFDRCHVLMRSCLARSFKPNQPTIPARSALFSRSHRDLFQLIHVNGYVCPTLREREREPLWPTERNRRHFAGLFSPDPGVPGQNGGGAMKKMMMTMVCALAAVVLLVGSVFAGDVAGVLLNEEDENANYEPLVFPFGDGIDPPAKSAEAHDALAWGEAEPTGGTRGTCGGACYYLTSNNVPYAIRCNVPEQSVIGGNLSATGFAYYDGDDPDFDDEPNRIIMCKRVPYQFGGQIVYEWERVGYCDRDALVDLRVYGMDAASTAARDVMGIIRYQLNDDGTSSTPIVGEDCNFATFTSVFEGGALKMYGRGYHDEVYGSQYDDSYLNGEAVTGLEGDDYIVLDNDEGGTYGYSIGLGDDGSDDIYGTLTADDIYGDDPTDYWYNGGDDYISGSRGNDLLRGSYLDDEILGGQGADQIWGGDGIDDLHGGDENDVIYGGAGDDFLWGDLGTDACSGGNGWDYCDCETEVYCEY